MTTTAELLADGFERIRDTGRDAVGDLDEAALTARLDPGANTIAWLLWHAARVQDDHVSGLSGAEQRWKADGWADRFELPFDVDAIGYGQSADDVAQVKGVTADDLAGYLDDVVDASLDYVRELDDAALGRVVDEAWDPPVTVAVRLMSVLNDDMQHIGQAALIRGVLERR